MVRVKALPYLLPSSKRIRTVDWRQCINNEEIPLQEIQSHWDPGATLHILVTISVDVDGVRTDCHLASDDLLCLVITWFSPGTSLRGRGSQINLSNSLSSLPATLELVIQGRLLADRVQIEARLVLAQAGKSNFKLAPRRPGSILWREEKIILLEGQASRFPVELIDFAEVSWLPEDAAWFLEWDPEDLDQMALGNLRLLINAKNGRVRRAVTDSNASDEIIKDIIKFDVGRMMIVGALNNEKFIRTPETCPNGSVGLFVRRLIHTLFPEETWEGVVQKYHQDKSAFECELQARFKLFQEV